MCMSIFESVLQIEFYVEYKLYRLTELNAVIRIIVAFKSNVSVKLATVFIINRKCTRKYFWW